MKNKGFSILELVIAVFALSIALFAIVSLFLFGADVYQNTSNQFKAMKLATNQIEYLKQLTADSAVLYNNYFEDYNTINNYFEFSRQTLVMQINAGDTSFLKLETIIKWNGISGELEYKLTGVNNY